MYEKGIRRRAPPPSRSIRPKEKKKLWFVRSAMGMGKKKKLWFVRSAMGMGIGGSDQAALSSLRTLRSMPTASLCRVEGAPSNIPSNIRSNIRSKIPSNIRSRRRYLQARLAETFPTPPSDSIWPLGVCRRRVPEKLSLNKASFDEPRRQEAAPVNQVIF